jgi:hypothetical protein
MLNISVGGDAAGGFLVDVHDGDKRGVYRPANVEDDHGAFASAVREHDPALCEKLLAAMGVDPDGEAKIAAANARAEAAEAKVSGLMADLDIARLTKPSAPDADDNPAG